MWADAHALARLCAERNTTTTTSADITARALLISATGINKIYDGNTSATVTFSDNRVAGDVLTATGSASFADKNVGTGKSVTVTGTSLAGADAGNYTMPASATTTANITARQVTVGGTLTVPSTRTYDRTTAATITAMLPTVAGSNLCCARRKVG